jgi:signal transduction histidine kinase
MYLSIHDGRTPTTRAQEAHHRASELVKFPLVQSHTAARILVVDDENGPRQSLRMLLKEECDVILADSVPEALKVLEEAPVDVIITDIRMPHHTGIDLLRAVKRSHPEIEVIILTGYGQLSTAMEAVEHGAFAYLEKPFDNEAMLAKVRACLRKRQYTRERRTLEYLALEANRFETIGHLISGALHDLGTPLSVISSHLELMTSNMERNCTIDRVHILQKQVEHCSDLVRTTMNFLRSAPEEHVPMRLNMVARLCADFARPLLVKQRVAVVTELDPGNCHIDGDLVLVRQAVLNLINNACQAMEGQEAPQQLRIQTYIDGDEACLVIQDSGPGVPAGDAERVFDPLFTTKGHKGTGLGLAVVRNVMERHGGWASLEPGEGRGARFVLRFPIGSKS